MLPEEQQQPTTELSSRTTAIFSWIEFLGLALFVASRFLYRDMAWLAVLALVMVASGYAYKTWADWKLGRKTFRMRLIILIFAIIMAVVFGYRAGQSRADNVTPVAAIQLRSPIV